MSESADPARDLDAIADELYALRPDAFAAARDEEVRKARGEKRAPLARGLSQLRRPTQSAWLINLLWRNQRDLMQQHLQLGEELSRAQAQASGADLHRLTARRRELESALLRGARALGEQAGVSVTATMERETQETLAAALARTDVADEVRSGRLVKPATYAGFGTLVPTMLPTAAPAQTARDKPSVAERAAPQADDSRASSVDAGALGPDDGEAGVVERGALGPDDGEAGFVERGAPGMDAGEADALRAARRAELEQRVEEARVALEVAAESLAAQTSAAEAAQQLRWTTRKRANQLQEQLRELEEQVREARNEATAAEQAAALAARRREQAQKVHEAALRTLAEQS